MTPTETAAFLRRYNEWRRDDEDISQFDVHKIGEAIDAAVEMIDHLEAAEKERDALRANLDDHRALVSVLREEVAKLRARIEEMDKQEPCSYIYEYSNPIDGSPVWRDKPGYWNAQFPKSSKPLYLAPGAKGE